MMRNDLLIHIFTIINRQKLAHEEINGRMAGNIDLGNMVGVNVTNVPTPGDWNLSHTQQITWMDIQYAIDSYVYTSGDYVLHSNWEMFKLQMNMNHSFASFSITGNYDYRTY